MRKGVFSVEELIIEAYQSKRDSAAIRAMLSEDEYLDETFQRNEASFPDGILVARKHKSTVGFLAFSGMKRGTRTTIFVSKDYRRQGIGTALIAKADALLTSNVVVERSMGACRGGDIDSLQFLYKHGYYVNYSSYLMEYEGNPLIESAITVRQYEDDDYLAFSHISEMAFYKLHERLGMLPTYFYLPEEWERKAFLESRNDRFVMLVDNEMVAVGVIEGNELHHVSVRTDRQSRGYGRAFVSFLVNEIMRRGEKTVKLGVVQGNPAKKLYDSLGFKEESFYHFVVRYYRPDSRLSRPPAELPSD